MKKYTVSVPVAGHEVYVIEAESREQALANYEHAESDPYLSEVGEPYLLSNRSSDV